MQSLERKKDTRRKIELGGLIRKAGLDTETTAVLYGALLEIVERLQSDDGNQQRTIWRTRGDLAFRDEGAGHID